MGIKGSSTWTTTVTWDRLDWNEIKDRIDMAKIATALLGPADEATRPPPALALPIPR